MYRETISIANDFLAMGHPNMRKAGLATIKLIVSRGTISAVLDKNRLIRKVKSKAEASPKHPLSKKITLQVKAQ